MLSSSADTDCSFWALDGGLVPVLRTVVLRRGLCALLCNLTQCNFELEGSQIMCCVLWGHHQTSALAGATVDSLHDVDELLPSTVKQPLRSFEACWLWGACDLVNLRTQQQATHACLSFMAQFTLLLLPENDSTAKLPNASKCENHTCSQVDHHVLVSEEEHNCDRVVQPCWQQHQRLNGGNRRKCECRQAPTTVHHAKTPGQGTRTWC